MDGICAADKRKISGSIYAVAGRPGCDELFACSSPPEAMHAGRKVRYDQFGLAGLRADRVNGMCRICERGTVLHINIEGVLHSTAPRVPFSLSFYIRTARRGPFDGQRRARLGQREPLLAG